MITTKSVRTPREAKKDGLRILVSRFRGHLPSGRYDLWMPNLGPSETLLAGFQAGRIAWRDFAKRYEAEIFGARAPEPDNRTIKNHGQKFTLRLLQELGRRGQVTLLCHCAEDEPHCHRHALQRILARHI
jgi:uncharacterized protein YeaO (DUF488 family)